MKAKRIRPSGARIELRRMIGEQRRELRATPDRIGGKILALSELGEAAIRTADPRTFEIINVGIR